jgi:hypothetical protein
MVAEPQDLTFNTRGRSLDSDGLDGPGSIPGSAYTPTLGPTQPPIQWVPGALSPRVTRQGREADHSPPTSAVVKNVEAIPPLPHMSSCHSA